MPYTLEICAGSISSVLAAKAGGANRIELCANLAEGGTTPSMGLIRASLAGAGMPIFPIIRPRGGDFVYSRNEVRVMKQDIQLCRNTGCQGIVLGALTPGGKVDKELCSELISFAGKMEITFHRAFDRCADLEEALEDVISLGCRRLLTSGGKPNAADAISQLADLVKQAGDRIAIMPGSGITTENLAELVSGTGAREFHSTAKTTMAYRDPIMVTSSYLYETDVKKVAEMRAILDNYVNID